MRYALINSAPVLLLRAGAKVAAVQMQTLRSAQERLSAGGGLNLE